MPFFREIITFLANIFFLRFIFIRLIFFAQNLRNRVLGNPHPINNNSRQLPVECLLEILECLEDDTSSLHSCILVNRLWSCLAIRILWRRPFEHVYPEKYGSRAIRTYVSCLSEQDKQVLRNNYVTILPLKQPFFNYPEYLQSYDCDCFISSIRAWLDGALENDIPSDVLVQHTARVVGNMICRRSLGFRDLRYWRKAAPDDMTLMDLLTYTGATEAFHLLQRFQFRSFHNADGNFAPAWVNLFSDVSISTRNLQHLTIHLSKVNRDTYRDLDTSIIDLIKSQNRLQSISLNTFWSSSNSNLIYEAISHHSRSLNYLRIQGLSDLPLLLQALRSCERLKTLEFARGKSDDDYNFGNLIPSTQPLRIKHLYYYFANGPVEFINTLLQMSNDNLLSFSSKQFTPQIITTVRNYCPNITHLCIKLMPSDFTLFKEQLLTTLQLEHLTLQTHYHPRLTQDQISQLALSLPESCTYFGIDFEISSTDLKLFLYNCIPKLKVLALHSISSRHVKYLKHVIEYALRVESFREVKLQKVNHSSDVTEYQYQHWLNKQLESASKKFPKSDRNFKISEAKPITFSHHETVFQKMISYST